MSKNLIYIQRKGEVEGPYARERLEDWLESKMVSPDLPARLREEDEWLPLSVFIPTPKLFEVYVPHGLKLFGAGLFFLAFNLVPLYFFNYFFYAPALLAPVGLVFGPYVVLRVLVLGVLDSESYNILDILVLLGSLVVGFMLYGYFKWGVYAEVFDPVWPLCKRVIHAIF